MTRVRKVELFPELEANLPSTEQRRRFLYEAKFYFDMTQLEQETKFSDELPNLDDFWVMRMGSSAVKPCLVLAEYVFSSNTWIAHC
jgi:hypothetical protein